MMLAQPQQVLAKRPRGDFDEAMQPAEHCSPHRVVMSPASKRTRGPQAAQAGASSSAASPFCSSAPPDGASPSAVDLASMMRQRIDPHTGEVLFTLEQVKDIVRHAVEEKERCLREAYDGILQEKLQEQFRAFSKFNEDYISRQLKSGDLSYCS